MQYTAAARPGIQQMGQDVCTLRRRIALSCIAHPRQGAVQVRRAIRGLPSEYGRPAAPCQLCLKYPLSICWRSRYTPLI